MVVRGHIYFIKCELDSLHASEAWDGGLGEAVVLCAVCNNQFGDAVTCQ